LSIYLKERKGKMKGAQILIKTLIDLSVKTVFGYPGGAVLDIYDELYKNSNHIEHIITAHEQGAAHAADGYARATGKVGVVIATSGPGATNLVTGIANAYMDSVPLIAITGNVSTSLLGKDSFQEVDIVDVTLPIVKHSYIVKDISKLENIIREAFYIASIGRPGPVLIDLPKDIQASDYEYSGKPVFFDYYSARLEKVDLDVAIKEINKSVKPFIYCGGGVVLGEAGDEVLTLSKKISAPIGLSMMGISAIPSSYELNLGMTGMHGKYAASKTKSEADLIIAIGVRFSDRATGNKNAYHKDRKIIHIDIDPAEINKNITADISICGNIKDILSKFIDKIETRKNDTWIKIIENYKNEQERLDFCTEELNAKKAIELVNSYCNEDTVIATDVGQHQMWVVQYYKFEKLRTLLTSGGLGTMGYGMGALIGGCIGSGRKKAVLFTGDGSFGMNLNELATVVSQKLPVAIVIINNGVLGMVRQWQKVFYDERYSQTTLDRQTDFVKLAEAFGMKGFRAASTDELKDILDNNFNDSNPILIDCYIDMDNKVLPMIPPGGSINEIIIS